mgnify:CR=1 FL=1
MIDIKKRHLDLLITLARKHLVKGTELRAYGSRVKGTSIDTSDLDLMMFTPEGEENDLLEFREALRDSNIPIFVQVFDWYHLPQRFRENFAKCNERLLLVD